jgi:hypothetical protein
MDSSLLDELIAQLSDGQPARVWANFNSPDSHDLFCDEFSLHVARRYMANDLSY